MVFPSFITSGQTSADPIGLVRLGIWGESGGEGWGLFQTVEKFQQAEVRTKEWGRKVISKATILGRLIHVE